MPAGTITNFQVSPPAGIWEQRLTGTVQFHGGQAELLGDVCVLDGQGLLHLRGMRKANSVSEAPAYRVGNKKRKVKEALRTGWWGVISL